MDVPGKVPSSINCHACGAVIDLTGQRSFTHVECPQCDALSVVPLRLGNFLLLAPLGIGGMGTVYKAIDLPLNRYVALKILRPKLAANPDFISQFTREARAAAAVSHRNVAQIYSFGALDGQYYIALELLERGSLDDRITKLGRMQEKELITCAIEIGEGLRAAHDSGLLHHDVKPGNILFSNEGVPKIVDFGLARPPRPAGAATASPAWGTPYYVAPEILAGQPEDIRSDIYSLGATLLHALTGHPPPLGAKPTPADALRSHAPDAHKQTVRLVRRMMARNPADRYASYEELIEDLKRAHEALIPVSAVAVAESHQRTLAAMAGACAVVVTAGILIWGIWMRRTAREPEPAVLPETQPTTTTPIEVVKQTLPETTVVAVVESPLATNSKPPTPAEAPAAEAVTPAPARGPEPAPADDAQRQREAEEYVRRLAADELKLVEAAEAQLRTAWVNYDFGAATAKYAALETKLATPQARQRLDRNKAVARWLVEFKTQLAADFGRQPSSEVSQGGRAVRADDVRVYWATEYGEVGMRWGDLSPGALVRMAESYTTKGGGARRYFALAVFCRQYAQERLVAGYVKKAVETAPALQSEAELIFGKAGN